MRPPRMTSIPRSLYQYLVENWVASAFLATIFSHWFVLLRFAGTSLGLVGTTGELTTRGAAITWPVFTVSLLFAVLKARGDVYNEQSKSRGAFIFQRLLECANDVTRKKAKRFCDYMVDPGELEARTPFLSITRPELQITSLLDNMQAALHEIFALSREEIGLSILYQESATASWEFLDSANTVRDLDLAALIGNPNTSARQVMDRHTDTIFYPDKQVGLRESKYVAGPRDADHGGMGSVLVREIALGNSANHPRAILCVTTYGKQICKAEDEDARQKILSIILPAFEARLQLELALLFIRRGMVSRCSSCSARAG